MYLLLTLLAPIALFLLLPGLAWFEERMLGPVTRRPVPEPATGLPAVAPAPAGGPGSTLETAGEAKFPIARHPATPDHRDRGRPAGPPEGVRLTRLPCPPADRPRRHAAHGVCGVRVRTVRRPHHTRPAEPALVESTGPAPVSATAATAAQDTPAPAVRKRRTADLATPAEAAAGAVTGLRASGSVK